VILSGRPSSLPRKILVAVEGSEPSLRDSSMKAVDYALNFASVAGADMMAVCVVQIPEYIEENTRENLRRELFAKSEGTLEEVARRATAPRVKCETQVLETNGAIATTICNFASKKGIDLIILGTRSSTSSLTKMMLGSVAAGVASNAECPVLVVR